MSLSTPLKVRDLISKLKKLDPDLEIIGFGVVSPALGPAHPCRAQGLR